MCLDVEFEEEEEVKSIIQQDQISEQPSRSFGYPFSEGNYLQQELDSLIMHEDIADILNIKSVHQSEEDTRDIFNDPDRKVVCILGETGSGKSSLANTLSGHQEFFKISGDIKSETDKIKGICVYMKNGEH